MRRRLTLLVVATFVIAFALVGTAHATYRSGAYYCLTWTPRGNASLKSTTSLVGLDPELGGKTSFVVSNAKTRFRFYPGESAVGGRAIWTARPTRVTRNRFFALARANHEITVRVWWVWKLNSHHKRYRYVTAIDGSYYQS